MAFNLEASEKSGSAIHVSIGSCIPCFDVTYLAPLPEVARVNIRQQMKNEANEMWELNRPKSNRSDLEIR